MGIIVTHKLLMLLLNFVLIIDNINAFAVQSEGANDSVVTESLMNQMKDDNSTSSTPRIFLRYKISSGLTVTSFAMDFCRRISSCYKCVEKRCVFKGHLGGVENGEYFCRHRRDVDENGGVEIILNTKDECDVLTRRFGMKVLTRALEPEDKKEELTHLEIVGIVTMTLTLILFIIVVIGGVVYVKRRLERSCPSSSSSPSPFGCQWRGSSLASPNYERFQPEKIDLMGIRR